MFESQKKQHDLFLIEKLDILEWYNKLPKNESTNVALS